MKIKGFNSIFLKRCDLKGKNLLDRYHLPKKTELREENFVLQNHAWVQNSKKNWARPWRKSRFFILFSLQVQELSLLRFNPFITLFLKGKKKVFEKVLSSVRNLPWETLRDSIFLKNQPHLVSLWKVILVNPFLKYLQKTQKIIFFVKEDLLHLYVRI